LGLGEYASTAYQRTRKADHRLTLPFA
jgi:hypothetical protein